MAITRSKKEKILEKLNKILRTNNSILVFNYKGCNIKQMSSIKNNLKEGRMLIVKNSLIKKAITDNQLTGPDFLNNFKGQSAIAFSNDGIALAHSLVASQKNISNLIIKEALINNQIIDADNINKIAKFKSFNGLRGKLLNVLSAPAQYMYNVLKERTKQSNI